MSLLTGSADGTPGQAYAASGYQSLQDHRNSSAAQRTLISTALAFGIPGVWTQHQSAEELRWQHLQVRLT